MEAREGATDLGLPIVLDPVVLRSLGCRSYIPARFGMHYQHWVRVLLYQAQALAGVRVPRGTSGIIPLLMSRALLQGTSWRATHFSLASYLLLREHKWAVVDPLSNFWSCACIPPPTSPPLTPRRPFNVPLLPFGLTPRPATTRLFSTRQRLEVKRERDGSAASCTNFLVRSVVRARVLCFRSLTPSALYHLAISINDYTLPLNALIEQPESSCSLSWF